MSSMQFARMSSRHHRSYLNLGNLFKELADIVVLCRACHEAFHKAGRIEEPNWDDWQNRQALYRAIELDKARERS